LVLASTSTVFESAALAAVTCAAGVEAASADSVPPLTPSLKPLTAPPRSAPMFLSFLVPKISTTTSSTMSQCQMLKDPMIVLLKRARGF
jgi:hypothetical protein